MNKVLNRKLKYLLLVLVIFLTSFFSVEIKLKNSNDELVSENNNSNKKIAIVNITENRIKTIKNNMKVYIKPKILICNLMFYTKTNRETKRYIYKHFDNEELKVKYIHKDDI